MFNLTLEKYKGPLDVLLELIQKNKLDISEISLSKITDEFVDYASSLSEKDSELVSDFVYIAGRLIRIKSNYMLNLSYEEDEAQDITDMLKEYAKYKSAASVLREMYFEDYMHYDRIPQEVFLKHELDLSKLSLDYLVQCSDIMRPKQTNEKPRFIKVQKSLPEKIMYISDFVQNKDECYFDELIVEKTADEKVVSLLGVLTLVKQEQLNIGQKNNFDRIKLEKRGIEHRVERAD